IDREVNTDTRDNLSQPIQQRDMVGAFGITVQNVPEVRGEVDRTAQTRIGKHHQTEVTNISARTRTTLQLIEAVGILSLIQIPAIERNKPEAERISGSGYSPLGADNHIGEARFAIKPADERRVRQIGRSNRKTNRHDNRI